MRRRLGALVRACFGQDWPIVAGELEPAPRWLRRPGWLSLRKRSIQTQVFTDGRHIVLPKRFHLLGKEADDGEILRLAALTLAARLTHGSVNCAPESSLARDLYWMADGARVDAFLAAEFPGLERPLAKARRIALALRPEARSLTRLEQVVEDILRQLLAAPIGESLPLNRASAADLAGWATRLAAAQPFWGLGRYRGVPVVPHWGSLEIDFLRNALPELWWIDESFYLRPRRHRPGKAGNGRVKTRSRSDNALVPLDPEDPREDLDGQLQEREPPGPSPQRPRPAPRDEAFGVEGAPRQASRNGDRATEEIPGGIAYPEWNCATESYRPHYCLLREEIAPAGDAEWVSRKLEEHRLRIAEVRRRFEALRPRRLRLARQVDGEEIDLDAYVDDFSDRRAGGSPSDRLYLADRRRRRDVAVAFLIDASGSTGAWVSDGRRVVDVEKEAALVLCEAVEALRDRYAVYAFSGWRPRNVRVRRVKAFAERYGGEVRRRIAAIERDCFTRLGAPLRHLTTELARAASRVRVLFLLSDGKPNDADEYEGVYGIEDTRQAVAEARLRGIHVFCLTVDREGSTYLPRMFGANGYAVVADVNRLAERLPELYRRITRA